MKGAVVSKMPNFLTNLKLKFCEPLHIIICGVLSKGQRGIENTFGSWEKNSLCEMPSKLRCGYPIP